MSNAVGGRDTVQSCVNGEQRAVTSLRVAQVEDAPGGDGRERLRQRIESYKSELRRIDAKIGRLRNDREGVMRRLDEAMQRLHAPTASLINDEVWPDAEILIILCIGQQLVSGHPEHR